MEQEISGISKFPEKRTTSRGEPKFSKRISGKCLFHSILNRDFRKFWSNGTRPWFSCRRYFKVPLPILLAASPLACRLRSQNFISRSLTIPPATQARLELATQLISHHANIFLGVIILGMNKPRPWKCPWTSSKKRKKRTKNENTAMNEQAKVDGKLKLQLSGIKPAKDRVEKLTKAL